MKKLLRLCALVVLLFVLSVSLVQAGGWAVVTLDSLPSEIVAGQPFDVTFVVRQHGREPLSGLSPTIKLIDSATGNSQKIYARPVSAAPGKYLAQIVVLSAGEWRWTVDAYGAFAQPLPKLTVLASAPAKKSPAPVAQSPAPSSAAPALPTWLAWVFGVIGLVGSALTFVQWMRTRSSAAFAFSIAALLLMLGGFVFATMPSAPPRAASNAPRPSAADEAALTGAQYGHDLFLAKGCIVCHAHAALNAERASAGLANFTVGPDLSTRYTLAPDKDAAQRYLQQWLHDPASVKAGTEMPNLNLSAAEIDALTLFLLSAQAK